MRSFTYIAFNKPYGVISQFLPEDPSKGLLQFNFPKGVYPLGRLDKDSEGLLLLSDDGIFAEKILDPKYGKEKIYWVQVENIPSEASLQTLRRGNIPIENYKTKPARVKILNLEIPERIPPIRVRKLIPTCWLELSISEGKNRQIRKMTAAIGHPTLRLLRVKVGNCELGNLNPGQWIEITKNDIILDIKK